MIWAGIAGFGTNFGALAHNGVTGLRVALCRLP